MNTELRNAICEAVADFASADGAYSDTAMLVINPETLEVDIADEEENPELDYYDMMDFVDADPENPGNWLPLDEAIDEVAESYS
ncbi:MAG: hypothetical protein U0L83_06720 [Muribaculaceae bacterium]|nr:hypothetical protein [Muribaculaceae bacterium]